MKCGRAGTNRPNAPSATAKNAPTERSKDVLERLGDLREDLAFERRRRRLVRANLAAVLVVVLVVAAEISAIATGLVEHRRTEAAIAFAISSGVGMLGAIAAIGRLAQIPDSDELLTKPCRLLIASAGVVGVIGAFIAAWPP